MSCLPEQIEKKRQEALQRLSKNKGSPVLGLSNTSISSPQAQRPVQSSSKQRSCFFVKTPNKKPYEKVERSLKTNQSPAISKHDTASNSIVTVNIKLMSVERFSVEMSTYCNAVIDLFKTVSSKNFNATSRLWTFAIADYDTLLSKLNNLRSQNVLVNPLPKFVLKCLKESVPQTDPDFSQIDETLLQTLLPFQLEGIRYGIHREGRCLIADDMGLGKTFQALGIMNYYRRNWPLLIVTTASMKNVWEETIYKYIPSVSIMDIQYMVSAKDYIGNQQVLIVSHDLMSRCSDKLVERGFGCIIIDESHNLKNHKAKVTQSARKLCKAAKRVVLLSGTPALSRPKELYSQLSLIDDKYFNSFFDYAKRYCDMQQTPYGLDASGQSNLQELEIVLRKKFMIRRKKDEVLGSLPKKKQEVIKLDLKLNQLAIEDKKRLETLSTQFENSVRSQDRHSILLTFFCETAKLKMSAVCAYVEDVIKLKEKSLVFAHHLVMLDAVEKVLQFNNVKYVRIDGNTPTEQRKYFIDKFQATDDYFFAVLSITSANAGITLTAARRVIFAELHWNPSILDQAEARVHRIGQANEVLIQYLLADGTADDHIWPLLKKKQLILQEMGLTKESFSSVPHKYEQSARKPAQNSTLTEFVIRSSTTKQPAEDDIIMDDGLDDALCSLEF